MKNYFKETDCEIEIPNIQKYIFDICNDYRGITYFPKHIIISDEERFRYYAGKYTDVDVVNIIDQTDVFDARANDGLKAIKRELSNSPKERNYGTIQEWIEALKRMLDNEELSPFDKDKIKRVIDAFENREFTDVILGEYRPTSRTIVLYRKPIIDTAKNGDVISNMKRVLVHEMFHAYHHLVFDGGKPMFTSFKKGGYGDVAKESLARFVEYNYCKDELNGYYCRELEYSWNTRFFENYPYSGAKYLEKTTSTRREQQALIQRLLADGRPDLIGAYHDIVYLYKQTSGFDSILANDIRNIGNSNKSFVPFPFIYKKNYIIESIKKYDAQPTYVSDGSAKLNFIAISKVKEELSKRKESFRDVLFEMLDAKNMTDPECYKAANIDRSAFNKIKNGKTLPKRNTISLLAIALKLDSKEYERFINAAGYGRSGDEEDPINIVGVYIDNKEYDLYEIELAIYEITGNTLAYYDGKEETVPLE